MKAYEEMEEELHAFLTPTLLAEEWSTRFTSLGRGH
jgi:hypothetical protein